jgi:hypothetical protein
MPLLAVTLFGTTVSGKEIAIAAAVVVVLILAVLAAVRMRRKPSS